ncbi:Soluble pyridine nucleotide transhydrogenase [Thalassoglobus neptunius]|uniref:Soluble pyridine nucleotide transhydrogenase n=1 Tax=Thalassoglobus neptunius TaxID=1938619 RepID=A0A5C5WWE6_9PLAN|nr:Si-specific NAD(P)(+) transhydrogenase [Thalassoglobus neptunius]TWT55284.1 Soluble pyridine nucleotide transhydrogenase [Thalassoglobus neptunius]
MSHQRFDIVVIGSGPGGEGAAMQASKLGKSVAVVERDPPIGGGCTHKGTIPSKALRNAIFQATTVFNNKLFRDAGISTIPDFPDLRRTASSVIEKQVDMRTSFYERNDVEVIRGHASFSDANTVIVTDELGGKRTVSAANFVIASGSRPYRPHDIDFNHGRVFDSDTILGLTHTPKSITIYGAGVIGCEYATMFRNIGCKVNLVNTREQLLEFLDDEICDALSYHLRDRGVLIRNREDYESVEAVDDGVILHLKSGKQIKTDILFWAAGRTGNSDHMGLEELGIEVNRRGQVGINEHFQTNVPSIYAVGDVIGPPSLASAAYVQGRYAAHHMILGTCETALIQEIPTGIYTSPEISSLGKTERELTETGVPYEVGHSMFKSLARAQITGQTVGMLKILFHRETLELLGIHCFGANASEIIHIGQAIMSQPGEHNTLMYFVNSTFNYPTMAEAYRVAALNGLNRLF